MLNSLNTIKRDTINRAILILIKIIKIYLFFFSFFSYLIHHPKGSMRALYY